MSKKLLKLPIFALIGGVVFYILIFLINFLGYGGAWTPGVAALLSYIPLALNIGIFIVIGLILRKTYDKKTFFKSATLLVLYSVVILIIQQLTMHFGVFNNTIDLILYLPVSLFRTVTFLSPKDNNSDIVNWIFVILALFEPYIFVLFGKKEKPVSHT